MRPQTLAFVLAFAATVVTAVAAGAAPLPTPPEGWALEVVAASPKVRHPSVVCCAPDGRVFVAEDPMDIRLPSADAKQGRILCLHPDGRITTFAENLYAVFGMQYLDGRLYVLHNPKFSVFVDDGSGVGKDRRDLIECTNPNPWALNWNDHVPANFRLAMDGYFYVAVGDKGVYGAVGTDGKRVDLHGGGILRLRPDGSGLEVFSTGVRNILDVAVNEEDELFTYDNTDEHAWMGRLTHMADGGFYGYPYDFIPRRPYTLWMMADYGAGAATGAACYTEDALPAEYRGDLFLADFGKRNVIRVKVEREGATYRAVSRRDLFTDVPPDFRPVGICFSPDGASLYICDWQHVDSKEDVEVGRLLKLTFKGATHAAPKPAWYVPAATGRPYEATGEQLVAALTHRSRDVRMVAQRRAAERDDAVAELGRLAVGPSHPPLARAHAIWALAAMEKVQIQPLLKEAAADASPVLRRQVMRLLGARRGDEAATLIGAGMRDEDPSVRFHAATACGRVGDARAVPALLGALGDADAWVRHAVQRALNRIGLAGPDAWEDIASGLRHESAVVRDGAAFAMRDTYDARLVAAVAEIAGDSTAPAAAQAAAIRVLGPLHRKAAPWKGEWWAYHPALGQPPRKTEAWEGTGRIVAEVRGALDRPHRDVRMAALEALAAIADPGAAGRLRELFAGETDDALARAALAALAACDDGRSADFLIAHLKSPARQVAFDPDVLRALGRMKAASAVAVLADFAKLPTAGPRAAAFDALVETGGDAAAATVIDLLTERDVDVRLGAIRAAAEIGNRSAVGPLVASYRVKETRAAAMAALARLPDARAAESYLEGLASPDFALRERCKAALREVRDDALEAVEAAVQKSPPDEVVLELQQVYEDHAKAKAGPLFRVAVTRRHPAEFVDFALSTGGDAPAGRKLFAESAAGGVGCATCHSVDGRGGTVGPDLSGVGAKYSRRDLAEAVVYPSKAVREGYQQVVVRTRGGQTYAGPVKAESPETLTLHESDGTLRTVRKSDVAARKDSGLSPMPEGLHSGLTPQQFADLVSYLESLRTESTVNPNAEKERP